MIHLHGTQAVAFRVLIVDDDPIQRSILARCVEMLGWTAEPATDLNEAVTLFSTKAPHIVLIDLRPGVADGSKLLHRLRRGRGDPTVIFVSGPDNPAQAEAFSIARELGLRVAGTLTKPVDPYRLHALLLSNPARPE